MARNRVIYNSEALFAGQKVGKNCYEEDEGVNSIKQLHRVQNANYSFNVARTDVNQFGELAAIDRIITDTPTVSLDFSYYVSNFANEDFLGFNVGPTGKAGGSAQIHLGLCDHADEAVVSRLVQDQGRKSSGRQP